MPRAQSVEARLPPITISARTPLAGENIAIFADQWKLIDADTLPAYLAFIRDHPGQARATLAIPLARRVTGYRLLARADQLAAGALTRRDVDLRAAQPGPRTPTARPARRPLWAAATMIVLVSAPTCQSAGFAAGERSRVWMNPAARRSTSRSSSRCVISPRLERRARCRRYTQAVAGSGQDARHPDRGILRGQLAGRCRASGPRRLVESSSAT